MRDALNKQRWVTASDGTMTQYRGNGTTKGFQVLSGSRVVL